MMRTLLIYVALGLWGGTAMAQSLSATSWKPDRNIELIVGANPGSGGDRAARLIERMWRERKLVETPAAVLNKAGGGGNVSTAYLMQRKGDAHALLLTSYNIVTNHITGKSALSYSDFTPIALLANEYIGYSVKTDSTIRSVADLIERLRKDPRALSFGVSSSLGGANHIGIGLFMKAAGVDVNKMRIVVFNSGGESLNALLGGHVDLIASSPSVIAAQLANGMVRPLAYAAPRRLGGAFAAVPTLTEAGFAVVSDNWRLMIAPPGLSAAQIAYWDAAFKRLYAIEEWKRELESTQLSSNTLNSTETRKYLDQQYAEVKAALTELGLARPAIKP
jgi:putative tricarboxylic transport membrane protein